MAGFGKVKTVLAGTLGRIRAAQTTVNAIAAGITGSKTIVFGLLKRNGNVYVEMVPDRKKAALREIIRVKLTFQRLFTPVAGAAITDWWIWVIKNIFA